jgi:hypothetical protein
VVALSARQLIGNATIVPSTLRLIPRTSVQTGNTGNPEAPYGCSGLVVTDPKWLAKARALVEVVCCDGSLLVTRHAPFGSKPASLKLHPAARLS